MPQTSYLPVYRVEYPLLAPRQKPGNVLWTGTFGITAASWSANNATFTTASPHGLGVGASVTIAGVNPSGYNGTYTTGAGTTGSTIVVPLTPTPGAYVSGGAASVPSTFSAVVTANDVPNKHSYAAGTIQSLSERLEAAEQEWEELKAKAEEIREAAPEEAVADEAQTEEETESEEEVEEEHEEEVEEDDGNGGKRKVTRRGSRRRR